MTVSPRVLKSGSAAELLAAGQYNYEDLRVRCESYLESVRLQARELLTTAQAQVDRQRKQAVEEGRQAGITQGLQQAEAQIQQKVNQQAEQLVQHRLQTLLPALRQATELLARERQQLLVRWEGAALGLALTIAEKLTRRSLEVDPSVIGDRITEALQLTLGSARVTVRVAAEDLEILGAQQNSVLDAVRRQADVQLIGDSSLRPGDCLIDTEQGSVDARIESQLQQFAIELLGRDVRDFRNPEID